MTDRRPHLGTRRSWVKLWTQQTLYGTTSQELEPAERWVWCGFLCLAGDSPEPGIICVAAGVPYTDLQLSLILQVDLNLLGSALSKMKEHGKITVNGSGIHICNWEHYQADYVRMAKMRQRNKSDASSGRNKCDAPMESRGRGEGRSEGDVEGDSSRHRLGGDEVFASFAHLYENEIGTLSVTVAQEIEGLIADGVPLRWFGEAVKIAACAGKRNLRYVKGIIKNYQAEGFHTEEDANEPSVDAVQAFREKYLRPNGAGGGRDSPPLPSAEG